MTIGELVCFQRRTSRRAAQLVFQVVAKLVAKAEENEIKRLLASGNWTKVDHRSTQFHSRECLHQQRLFVPVRLAVVHGSFYGGRKAKSSFFKRTLAILDYAPEEVQPQVGIYMCVSRYTST